MIIIIFILDGLVNIIVSFISFIAIWLMHQLNEGAAEWMSFPVIVQFFNMAQAIGTALFLAGVLYSVCENLLNYNQGQGISSFQSTTMNITKAFIAVLLFTRVPPLLFRWSIELTGMLSHVSWVEALAGGYGTDFMAMFEGTGLTLPDVLTTSERLLEAVGMFFGLIFRLINLLFIVWGVYRLALSAMQRIGVIMVLTARMSFSFFSFARGMSDGFMKAAMDMLGVNVIMFIQMYMLLTALAYSDRNPILVWGLIMTGAKVDQILQFGIDLGSRTGSLSTLHSATVVAGAGKKFFGNRGNNKKGSLGGVASS